MFNLQHPEITRTERFGSLADFSFLGECSNCGKELNAIYDKIYSDKRHNTFCCKECGVEYYDIKLVEV